MKKLLLLFLLIFTACNRPQPPAATANNNEAAAVVQPSPVKLASLDDRGALPDFALTDQKGRKVTLNDLKGQVWVADFFFTNCTGVCPMMTARMERLQQSLAAQGLRLVSITVDPERDTAAALAKHAAKVGAKDQWLFLTGEKQSIIDLSVKGFHLSASDDPNSHSQRLVLVDRAGHIRGYYRADDDEEITLLERNAAQLLKN